MKRKPFTDERIAFTPAGESGTPIAKVICKMGITEPTFYRWLGSPAWA